MNNPPAAPDATISRAEFSRLQAVAARRLLPALLAPWALMIIAIPFKVWKREWSELIGLRYPSVEADIAMVLPACTLGVLMTPWLLWWARRREARANIPCSQCGKPLVPEAFVFATGCCPHCQHQVLGAPLAALRAVDQCSHLPIAAPQFENAVSTYRRRIFVAKLIPLGAMVLCAVAGFFVLPSNSPLHLAPLFVCGIWMLVWIVKIERRQNFACPSCGHRLDGNFQIVAKTGNCTRCGHAVFAEASEKARTDGCRRDEDRQEK